MNEWMNEGVLIRYLGKWMTFRRPLGLALRGRVRWGELRVGWGPWRVFSDRLRKRLFSILDGFWEVWGNQNGAPNRVFACFFAMFFSSAFRHRFGLHFWRLRTSKNRFSLERGANFHKIGVFEKSFKKAQFWLRLGRPKPSKIDEKSCSKLSLFLTSFFFAFFCVF